MEADIAMETLPDGTKRSRRQIKEPVKFVPQDVPTEPKKIPIRNTVNDGGGDVLRLSHNNIVSDDLYCAHFELRDFS